MDITIGSNSKEKWRCAYMQWRIQGGLQWFQLKPPLKERAPLIRDDRYHEEQKSP